MAEITLETRVYEFTKEIKVRPTDNTINARCVYCLARDYTYNEETEDFDEELYVPFKHCRQGIGRALLKAAVSDAKKRYPSMTIRLLVKPLSSEINQDILTAFCESEDFSIEQADNDVIIMSC